MKIKYIDSEVVYTKASYDSEDNTFIISSSDDKNNICYQPVLQLDNEYDINNFDVYLFKNNNYNENSIFQVYIQETRIGWIFPIQALLSKEHSFATNVYFLKYAFVATSLLLNSIASTNEQNFPNDYNVNLSDYFESSSSILVIDNTNTKEIQDFNILNYLVSLYKYGYSFGGIGNVYADMTQIDKRINLKPLSNCLKDIENINYIFSTQLSTIEPQYAAYRFLLCYQLIEMMIATVFDFKFNNLLNDFKNSSANLFDLRESLTNIVNEKYRVNLLFNDFVKISTDDSKDVSSLCNKFLEDNKRSSQPSLSLCIYSVRCFLVHSLYSVNQESINILEEINKIFINIIIDMLTSFNINT